MATFATLVRETHAPFLPHLSAPNHKSLSWAAQNADTHHKKCDLNLC